MKFIETLKKVQIAILGEKMPKDHWKKYQKPKS